MHQSCKKGGLRLGMAPLTRDATTIQKREEFVISRHGAVVNRCVHLGCIKHAFKSGVCWRHDAYKSLTNSIGKAEPSFQIIRGCKPQATNTPSTHSLGKPMLVTDKRKLDMIPLLVNHPPFLRLPWPQAFPMMMKLVPGCTSPEYQYTNACISANFFRKLADSVDLADQGRRSYKQRNYVQQSLFSFTSHQYRSILLFTST